MWRQRILGVFVLGCILHTSSVTGLWSCSSDAECSSLTGGICRGGDCVCPSGQEAILGGTVCVDVAPYHTSPCVESHQCSRMSIAFECRRDKPDDESNCVCQENHHYFLGRCWPTVDYGSPCTVSEECMATIRDPYALTCNGTCQCSEGYYERQRGECRRIGKAVGDGCVLDQDCQFEGGACDIINFVCYDINAEVPETRKASSSKPSVAPPSSAITRQHAAECSVTSPCPEPFVCSNLGACLCPVGYYASGDGSVCLAELGSPSTEEQCTGLFAVVRDGICTCPANFFFETNMRDCTKVARTRSDSCVTDSNCFTFGAASKCVEQPPWGLLSCQCVADLAVWEEDRQICRLFAGIGESCEVDSDCLAGGLEIQCVVDSAGLGVCTCPEGYAAVNGLCLTTGLELGDECQATQECTGTPNTVCEDSRCSCDSTGYQELDGSCAPIIGGVCEQDSDCVIENTACTNTTKGLTCQCYEDFIVYDDACWPKIDDVTSQCNVSAQCHQLLGEASSCIDLTCVCDAGHHYRDGGCWPVTALFEGCSRTSQCFLGDVSQRVVCRNSLCQCDFRYPYSEALHTCTSSTATRTLASLFLLISTLLVLI